MGKNLWGDLKAITKEKAEPQDVLVEQTESLKLGTDGLLIGTVERVELKGYLEEYYDFIDMPPDFVYQLKISSPFVEKYSYLVCTIAYTIKFYPIAITVSQGVAEELEDNCFDFADGKTAIVKNEATYEEFIGKVLKSQEIEQVLGGLYSIAKKENDSYDLPF